MLIWHLLCAAKVMNGMGALRVSSCFLGSKSRLRGSASQPKTCSRGASLALGTDRVLIVTPFMSCVRKKRRCAAR